MRAAVRRPVKATPPPEELDYVFVVTYGRSGSTLLQGLVNSLPGTLMRGENGFYVLSLYRAMSEALRFKEAHAQHGVRRASSAFYGLAGVERDAFVRSARDLVVGQLIGPRKRPRLRRLGFKEVLWHRIEPDETEGFFGWFDEVFPGARYLLNTREHAQVAASGFWKNVEEEEVARALARVEEIQAFLRETRPDRVYDVRYEHLTDPDEAVSGPELEGLARFVTGRSTPRMMATFRETLGEGHGPHPFKASGVAPGRADG